MLDLVFHWYAYCEVYAVLLVWVVVPLSYLGIYLYMHRRAAAVAIDESKHDAH